MTTLLENLDLFDGFVQSAAFKALFCLKMPAQFLILMHAYYAQSYAGIIASSLFDTRLHKMCGVTPYMEVTTAWCGISLIHHALQGYITYIPRCSALIFTSSVVHIFIQVYGKILVILKSIGII